MALFCVCSPARSSFNPVRMAAINIRPPNTVATAPAIFDEHFMPNLVPQASAPLNISMLRRHTTANQLEQGLRVRYDQGPQVVQHPGEAMAQEQQQELVTIDLRTVHNPNLNGLLPDDFPNLAIDESVDNYRINGVLVPGHFSMTYRATSIQHQTVICIKVLNDNGVHAGLHEVLTHAKIIRADPDNERYVLRMLDFFHCREHIMIVTELLNACLTAHYVHREAQGTRAQYYTAATAGALFAQLLNALTFLHGLGIAHCDVKPANVCIVNEDARTFKLVDLGSAVFDADPHFSEVQSRYYRAPEVLLLNPWNKKIDVWGLALTVLEPVIGHILFQFASSEQMLAAHQAVLGPFPGWMLAGAPCFATGTGSFYEVDPEGQPAGVYILAPETLSLRDIVATQVDPQVFGDVDAFVAFLTTLLAIDPNARPTAVAANQHAWMDGYRL